MDSGQLTNQPRPMLLPLWIRRILALLLLPFGLICLGVPFYMMTQPARWAIFGDTYTALGGGRDAGLLKAAYVDCTGSRSGSSSGRGIGITEYGCVIDLAETKPAAPAPAPVATPQPEADPYAGLSYEEAEKKHAELYEAWKKADAEQTRRYKAGFDAFVAESKARNNPSARIERKLGIDKSGELPTVRLLSGEGEPLRVGLVWGWGELAWRWLQLLIICLLFFGFGGAIMLVQKLVWFPKRTFDKI